MRIGILGSGLMGGKLGTLFARAGHAVTFSYSRDDRKLARLAKQADAEWGTVADAVRGADALILAVHWSRVDNVLKEAGALAGKLVISCTLPMTADDSTFALGRTISGAEALAAKRPRAHIVSAFSTVPSEVLFAVFAARKKKTRPDLVYCGDYRAAKKKAAGLIRALGFNPVDVGALKIARYIEPFSLLMGEIAYEGKQGPQMAYRLERF
jgi:predicted dinucleotide-binding enzyme